MIDFEKEIFSEATEAQGSKVMRRFFKYTIAGAMLSLAASYALAVNLTIPLAGQEPLKRHVATYQCDQHAEALGLPTGPFQVEYLNGAGNSLAVLPVGGRSLIFAGVTSASGARYAADRFIWWEAGSRGIHLYSDSLTGKDQSSCHTVPAQ